MSTEQTNITNILHPLLVQLFATMKQQAMRRQRRDRMNQGEGYLFGSASTYTPSAVELHDIATLEQEYYASTTFIRSHRQNVLLSLKPKLRQFVIRQQKQLTRSESSGGSSSGGSSSSGGGESKGNQEQRVESPSRLGSDSNNGGIHSSTATASSKRGEQIVEDPALVLTAGGCPPGVLHVQVIRGYKLRETQRLLRQDPYVTLQCSGMRKDVRTKYIRSGGTEPTWSKEDNNTFSLHIQGSMDVVQVSGGGWVGCVGSVGERATLTFVCSPFFHFFELQHSTQRRVTWKCGTTTP